MQARMDAQLLREAEKYARQPFRVDVTLDDSDSGKPIYVARIPELPGCHTHAGTMSEAVSLLNEVKVEFIYFLLEDGLPVPAPLAATACDATDEDLRNLFELATFVELEPGMDNEFSIGLEDAIERGGKPALEAIEGLVLSEFVPSSIAMEALQYIGDTESDKFRDERRQMLERCLLKSSSAWVRDGAGLGIAALDDPRSIPALGKALVAETSDALKADLQLVLDQLRETLLEQ